MGWHKMTSAYRYALLAVHARKDDDNKETIECICKVYHETQTKVLDSVTEANERRKRIKSVKNMRQKKVNGNNQNDN